MTIKALLTTALLLGSSTLALARPATLADGQVRDHRTPTVLASPPIQVAQAPRPAYDRRGGRFERQARPVVLSSAASLDRGRAVIALQATGGKTKIRTVEITFANGRTQRVTANVTLTGSATYAIDLTGDMRQVAE